MIQLTPPASTAVTLSQSKAHCRVDFDDDNDYLTSLLTVAEEFCEQYTQTTFVEQGLRLKMDQFPCGIYHLPQPPLKQIDEISYSIDGVRTVLDSDSYEVDESCVPARLKINNMPNHDNKLGGIWIDFTAGQDVADVPAGMKHCILLLVHHLYEMRMPVTSLNIKDVPFSIKNFLDQEVVSF